MARIYFGSYKTFNQNEYRVEIYDGASGSTTSGTELKIAASGVIFDYQGNGDTLYERGTFTRKTKAVVPFVVNDTTTEAVFQNLGVDQEDKYALVIYRNNTLHWVGRILADEMQYERRALVNIPFEITAVDGLSLLDRFRINPTWFNSTTLRIDVIDLIRRCIGLTGLAAYYDYLGVSNDYILDATEALNLKTIEINLNSTIADFEIFQDQVTDIDNPEAYKYCNEVIEDILLAIGCRLQYERGSYWIFEPIYLAANNPIDYKRYNTSAVFVSTFLNYFHTETLGSGRREFEAFPVITHQAALRHIRLNYKRRAVAWTVRKQSLATTTVVQVGPLTPPSSGNFTQPILNVKALLKFGAQGTAAPPKLSKRFIRYRVFGWDASTGWKGWDDNLQEWITVASQPSFISVEVDVVNYELAPNQMTAVYTVDFQKTFDAFLPNGYDFFAEFDIPYIYTTSPMGPRPLVNLDIWGSAFLDTEDIDKKTSLIANTNNENASEIYETDIVYGYPEAWVSPQLTGRGGNAVDLFAAKMMSLYCKSPMTLEGNYIDAGAFNSARVLVFDGFNWLFNGGKFTTMSEQWQASWIRVEQNNDNVVINTEDIIDEATQGDKTSGAVFRLMSQVQTIRESISGLGYNLPYSISEIALQSPTTTPSLNTDFTLKLAYVDSDEQLFFKVAEDGKARQLTAGTYTQSTDEELIICDTLSGDINVTLGDATLLKGKKYVFKKTNSLHKVKLIGTIDDNGEFEISAKNESVTVQSDGVQWWIIAQFH